MKKLFMLLFLSTTILCGCTKRYDRNDVIEYIEAEHGLKDFSVEKAVEEVKDEQGHIEYIWTVEDYDSGIVFHVNDVFIRETTGLFITEQWGAGV